MFAAHGNFGITRHNNVLIVVVSGPWNEETAQAYSLESAKLAKPLLGSPWAQIMVISEFELGTPEANNILSKLFQQANEHGLVKEAIVNSSDSRLKNELFGQTVDIAVTEFESKQFENKKDAVEWLASQGFSVNDFDGWEQIEMRF
jgi:hypothetical protein